MAAAGWLARLQHQPPGLPRGVTPEEWALAGNPIEGTCPVCGTTGVQFCGFTENFRESGACSQCGAANRQRQMAFSLRKKLRLATHGSLALPAGCHLYNAETTGALHATLARWPGYVCSGYWGDQFAPGSIVNGIRHEDLERLSFADGTLDFILTSDVLEHVSDAYRAHGEIFRTLRPGGWHIFTVPFNPRPASDDVRARRRDGEIEYLAEPLYHGDPLRPDQGVLVWRIFGNEMLARLAQIGFSTVTMRVRTPDQGILGDNALVFTARKPPARRWWLDRRNRTVQHAPLTSGSPGEWHAHSWLRSHSSWPRSRRLAGSPPWPWSFAMPVPCSATPLAGRSAPAMPASISSSS